MAVASGRVEIGMDGMGAFKPQAEGGKVRALALTTAKGSQGMMGMEEAGVPGFDFPTWTGIGTPPRTPRAVVDVLNAGFNAAFREPETKAFFARLGYDTPGGTPEQFGRLLNYEVETWIKVIKSANVQFE